MPKRWRLADGERRLDFVRRSGLTGDCRRVARLACGRLCHDFDCRVSRHTSVSAARSRGPATLDWVPGEHADGRLVLFRGVRYPLAARPILVGEAVMDRSAISGRAEEEFKVVAQH